MHLLVAMLLSKRPHPMPICHCFALSLGEFLCLRSGNEWGLNCTQSSSALAGWFLL